MEPDMPDLEVGATYNWDGPNPVVLKSAEMDADRRVLVLGARGRYYLPHVVDLVKVQTFTEQWLNVYPGWTAIGHFTREASDFVGAEDRIGVLHLFPDGTTEMLEP